MKKIVIVSALLMFVITNYSQPSNKISNYNGEEKPALHKVHAMFDSSSAVGIVDDRKIEYVSEHDNLFVYETDHCIIKVMNDKGIEMYNKIYIYMYPNAEISNIKARTILPDGRVINLDTTKIKETEEDGNTYKIFAMEGVEKGSEVEYTYTMKRNFSLFGTETFQGGNIPYQEEYFTLITPAYLKYSVKGYNGFKINADSVADEKRYITGYDTDVKQLDEEKYSYREPYLKRVEYKLSYNMSKDSTLRLYTWKEFAKNAFAYYTKRTDKEEKALDNFIKQIPLNNAGDEASKILAIEDYVKNTINIDKKLIAEDAGMIDRIMKTKAADDEGIVRLFAGIFDKLNITYQFVFASDRTSYALDEEVENWNRADKVLFYFPSANNYISPESVELRYPYIPFNLAASRGLFLKGTVIGSFKTAVGTFKNIDIVPFEQHAENMEADVRFDETLDTLIIQSKQILKGYPATQYRPIYVFTPKDKQDEFNKEIIKNVANSTNISNIKIDNTQLTDCFDNKPLIIAADIKSTEMTENAGSKILLKIGEIIGPQIQMYQEKPRQLPVELPFPHVLDRKITLHIPEGYTIKNLNDININEVHKEGDEVTMGFVSSYVVKNDVVEITINETYRLIKYPLEQFNEFKNVINASADFNKVVLVLEKKG